MSVVEVSERNVIRPGRKELLNIAETAIDHQLSVASSGGPVAARKGEFQSPKIQVS
jgi:hypothetical protein